MKFKIKSPNEQINKFIITVKEDIKPNSVIYLTSKPMSIYLNRTLLRFISLFSNRFMLPTRKYDEPDQFVFGKTETSFLFGIAPDKAFPAFRFTTKSGSLLHYHFTLILCKIERFVSVELSLRYRDFQLGSIPSYGVRTFLPALTL